MYKFLKFFPRFSEERVAFFDSQAHRFLYVHVILVCLVEDFWAETARFFSLWRSCIINAASEHSFGEDRGPCGQKDLQWSPGFIAH